MKDKKVILEGIAGVILFILIIVFSLGISWLITCAVIKLVTLCFGLTFNLKVATGIWLVLGILGSVFKSVININRK